MSNHVIRFMFGLAVVCGVTGLSFIVSAICDVLMEHRERIPMVIVYAVVLVTISYLIGWASGVKMRITQ